MRQFLLVSSLLALGSSSFSVFDEFKRSIKSKTSNIDTRTSECLRFLDLSSRLYFYIEKEFEAFETKLTDPFIEYLNEQLHPESMLNVSDLKYRKKTASSTFEEIQRSLICYLGHSVTEDVYRKGLRLERIHREFEKVNVFLFKFGVDQMNIFR